MIFEYDPKKSEANKAKHGIDFEETKALWNVGGLGSHESATHQLVSF